VRLRARLVPVTSADDADLRARAEGMVAGIRTILSEDDLAESNRCRFEGALSVLEGLLDLPHRWRRDGLRRLDGRFCPRLAGLG
jgi:hypothetical protein